MAHNISIGRNGAEIMATSEPKAGCWVWTVRAAGNVDLWFLAKSELGAKRAARRAARDTVGACKAVVGWRSQNGEIQQLWVVCDYRFGQVASNLLTRWEVIKVEQLLTVQEAAEHFRVSLVTMRRWVKSGKVKSIKLGYKTVRIKADDIARLEVSR